MNSITLQNKLLTFPKEFACNPSLIAEVLINFMRESQMLLSLSLTLGCPRIGSQADKGQTEHPL